MLCSAQTKIKCVPHDVFSMVFSANASKDSQKASHTRVNFEFSLKTINSKMTKTVHVSCKGSGIGEISIVANQAKFFNRIFKNPLSIVA